MNQVKNTCYEATDNWSDHVDPQVVIDLLCRRFKAELFFVYGIWFNVRVGVLTHGKRDVATCKSWVPTTPAEFNSELEDTNVDKLDSKDLNKTIVRKLGILVFDRNEADD